MSLERHQQELSFPDEIRDIKNLLPNETTWLAGTISALQNPTPINLELSNASKRKNNIASSYDSRGRLATRVHDDLGITTKFAYSIDGYLETKTTTHNERRVIESYSYSRNNNEVTPSEISIEVFDIKTFKLVEPKKVYPHLSPDNF